MQEQVIFESFSHACPLSVFIEQSEATTYAYLVFHQDNDESEIISSVWIRNHLPAPQNFQSKSSSRGDSGPLMPIENCDHPSGLSYLDAKTLQSVWFEDGTGCALLERGELLCLIRAPLMNLVEGLPGYSKHCTRPSELAQPLMFDLSLLSKFKSAQKFFQSWNDRSWVSFSDPRMALYEKFLGSSQNYYSMGDELWPPRSLIKHERDGIVCLMTLGISLLAQPGHGLAGASSADFPLRFEMGLAMDHRVFAQDSNNILSFLAFAASIPWRYLTYFGQGHTIAADNVFSLNGSISHVLLVEGHKHPIFSDLQLPHVGGQPTSILWATPISRQELQSIEHIGGQRFIQNSIRQGRSFVIGR